MGTKLPLFVSVCGLPNSISKRKFSQTIHRPTNQNHEKAQSKRKAEEERKEQREALEHTYTHTHSKYDIRINSHYPIIKGTHCVSVLHIFIFRCISSLNFRAFALWWLQSTSILNELILNVLHLITANEKHAIQFIYCCYCCFC